MGIIIRVIQLSIVQKGLVYSTQWVMLLRSSRDTLHPFCLFLPLYVYATNLIDLPTVDYDNRQLWNEISVYTTRICDFKWSLNVIVSVYAIYLEGEWLWKVNDETRLRSFTSDLVTKTLNGMEVENLSKKRPTHKTKHGDKSPVWKGLDVHPSRKLVEFHAKTLKANGQFPPSEKSTNSSQTVLMDPGHISPSWSKFNQAYYNGPSVVNDKLAIL